MLDLIVLYIILHRDIMSAKLVLVADLNPLVRSVMHSQVYIKPLRLAHFHED